MDACTGITVKGAGIVSSGMASTSIGGFKEAWPSVAVTRVAVPIVTGVVGMPVTCLLLVLCLLPIRAQKHLL